MSHLEIVIVLLIGAVAVGCFLRLRLKWKLTSIVVALICIFLMLASLVYPVSTQFGQVSKEHAHQQRQRHIVDLTLGNW
jgi:hypothetical protein